MTNEQIDKWAVEYIVLTQGVEATRVAARALIEASKDTSVSELASTAILLAGAVQAYPDFDDGVPDSAKPMIEIAKRLEKLVNDANVPPRSEQSAQGGDGKTWWHAFAAAADAVEKSADVWSGFSIQDAKTCVDAYQAALASAQKSAVVLDDERASNEEIARVVHAEMSRIPGATFYNAAKEALARAASPQATATCSTCKGHGRIGGPSYYAPDEGGDPCPDCATEARQAQTFEQWASDPQRADKIPLAKHPNGAYSDSRSYLIAFGWNSALNYGIIPSVQELEGAKARNKAMEMDIAENDELIDSLRDQISVLETKIATAEKQELAGYAWKNELDALAKGEKIRANLWAQSDDEPGEVALYAAAQPAQAGEPPEGDKEHWRRLYLQERECRQQWQQQALEAGNFTLMLDDDLKALIEHSVSCLEHGKYFHTAHRLRAMLAKSLIDAKGISE